MTELIAAIAGPYLIVTGLGFALSRVFYERMIRGGPDADPILINLSGAVHFVIGMVILLNHFAWDTPAEIAVTLLGVAPVLKGVALIAVPEMALKPPTAVGRTLTVSTAGFLIAGAYFCYVGYWPQG